MLVLGRKRTVEELGALALDENRGEVLHLAAAHFRGVVLDVGPAKACLRKLPCEREKSLAIRHAAIAPKRAKAGHLHRCPILFTRLPD